MMTQPYTPPAAVVERAIAEAPHLTRDQAIVLGILQRELDTHDARYAAMRAHAPAAHYKPADIQKLEAWNLRRRAYIIEQMESIRNPKATPWIDRVLKRIGW